MSAKADAVNHLITVTNELNDLIFNMKKHLDAGAEMPEIIRQDMAKRLEVVRAAVEVAAAPADEELARVVGPILLSRIESASASKSPEEWDALGSAAVAAASDLGGDLPQAVTEWMEISEPVIRVSSEAARRAQDQQHDLMVEGFRRAAEQTPGLDLRISEVHDGATIHDEHIVGPAKGEQDRPGEGVQRLSTPVRRVFGVDAEHVQVDAERLNVLRHQVVGERLALRGNESQERVRLELVEQLLEEMQRDLTISDATGDLPAPIADLSTAHFPALRVQLLRLYVTPLTEGSTYSRARQGDRSAEALMAQFIIMADAYESAEPYFLPTADIGPAAGAERRQLPATRTFLVWHDNAVDVAPGVSILAWLFATDDQGNLFPICRALRLSDSGHIEDTWCSLNTGDAAELAQTIATQLTADVWAEEKSLYIPGAVGGREWKKTLARSLRRARAGALHGLRTLR